MAFCRKIISIFLIQAFLLSNITFAVPTTRQNTPSTQEDITTNPDKVVIPREYGLVKSTFTGKDGNLIIHIQDAHCNYEAQTNIVKILENLIKNYNVSLVSVEGADGNIDTTWFKAFPDDEVRREVADYFMKKGEITGPEFLSITTDYPIKLFGAETRQYYIQNLNAFTSSYGLKDQTERHFNQIKTILNRLKNYIYSEELKALDSKMQDYESKKLQFNDYIRFLQSMAEKYKINLRQFDNFFKLVSVLIYEKKIDFNVTDKERSALIDELSKKMSKEALTELVSQSLSFKSGKLSSAEYYTYLKGLAVKNDIELANKYPNLYNYIIYNAVYSRIENERLFNDIKKIEIAIKEKLFKNDDQRTLERLSRHIDILLGLINIKLLNGDFEYYKTNKDGFSEDAFTDFIKKKTIQYGLAYDVDTPNDVINDNIQKLEDFYSIAIKRDRALVDNTLNEMKREKQEVAVLITGGFHSEGIIKFLEKDNISYMVVCPNITKDVPSPYIQILMNQRTPIEEILIGQPEAKQSGMLAPISVAYVVGLNERQLNNLSQEIKGTDLKGKAIYVKEGWIDRHLSRWLKKALAYAGSHRFGHDRETMKDAYKYAVGAALSSLKQVRLTQAEKNAIINEITSSPKFNEVFDRAYGREYKVLGEIAPRRDDAVREKTVGTVLTNPVINNAIKNSEKTLVIFYDGKIPEDIEEKYPQYAGLVDDLRRALEDKINDLLIEKTLSKDYISGVEDANLRNAFTRDNLLNVFKRGSRFTIKLVQPKDEVPGVKVPGIIMVTEDTANYGHYSTRNKTTYSAWGVIDELLGDKSLESRRKAVANLAHELVEYVVVKHAYPDVTTLGPEDIDKIEKIEGRAHYIAQEVEVEIAGQSKTGKVDRMGKHSALDDTLEDVTKKYFEDKRNTLIGLQKNGYARLHGPGSDKEKGYKLSLKRLGSEERIRNIISDPIFSEEERVIVTKIMAFGKGGIFRFWEELNDSQKRKLIEQIMELDLDVAEGYYKKFVVDKKEEVTIAITDGNIESPTVYDLRRGDSLPQNIEALQIGEEAFRKGKVAILELAGGSGARLRHFYPKITLKTSQVQGKSLGRIRAEKIRALAEEYGKPVPWIIMTSDVTHKKTRDFFNEHNIDGKYFGEVPKEWVKFVPQRIMPLVTSDGEFVLGGTREESETEEAAKKWAKYHIAVGGFGHGDARDYILKNDEVIKWLSGFGVEYVMSVNVDNAFLAGPRAIGYHILSGEGITTGVEHVSKLLVEITRPDEEVGIATLYNDKDAIIEYHQFPPQFAYMRYTYTVDGQKFILIKDDDAYSMVPYSNIINLLREKRLTAPKEIEDWVKEHCLSIDQLPNNIELHFVGRPYTKDTLKRDAVLWLQLGNINALIWDLSLFKDKKHPLKPLPVGAQWPKTIDGYHPETGEYNRKETSTLKMNKFEIMAFHGFLVGEARGAAHILIDREGVQSREGGFAPIKKPEEEGPDNLEEARRLLSTHDARLLENLLEDWFVSKENASVELSPRFAFLDGRYLKDKVGRGGVVGIGAQLYLSGSNTRIGENLNIANYVKFIIRVNDEYNPKTSVEVGNNVEVNNNIAFVINGNGQLSIGNNVIFDERMKTLLRDRGLLNINDEVIINGGEILYITTEGVGKHLTGEWIAPSGGMPMENPDKLDIYASDWRGVEVVERPYFSTIALTHEAAVAQRSVIELKLEKFNLSLDNFKKELYLSKEDRTAFDRLTKEKGVKVLGNIVALVIKEPMAFKDISHNGCLALFSEMLRYMKPSEIKMLFSILIKIREVREIVPTNAFKVAIFGSSLERYPDEHKFPTVGRLFDYIQESGFEALDLNTRKALMGFFITQAPEYVLLGTLIKEDYQAEQAGAIERLRSLRFKVRGSPQAIISELIRKGYGTLAEAIASPNLNVIRARRSDVGIDRTLPLKFQDGRHEWAPGEIGKKIQVKENPSIYYILMPNGEWAAPSGGVFNYVIPEPVMAQEIIDIFGKRADFQNGVDIIGKRTEDIEKDIIKKILGLQILGEEIPDYIKLIDLLPNYWDYKAGLFTHGEVMKRPIWDSYFNYVVNSVVHTELKEFAKGKAKKVAKVNEIRESRKDVDSLAKQKVIEELEDSIRNEVSKLKPKEIEGRLRTKDIVKVVGKTVDVKSLSDEEKKGLLLDIKLAVIAAQAKTEKGIVALRRQLKDRREEEIAESYANEFDSQNYERVSNAVKDVLDWKPHVLRGRSLRELLTNLYILDIPRSVMKVVLLNNDPKAALFNPWEFTNDKANRVALEVIQDELRVPARPSLQDELKRWLKMAIGSGVVDLNSPSIRADYETDPDGFIEENFREATQTDFGHPDFFGKDFERFYNEIIASKAKVKLVYFLDNNGEAVFDLMFIQKIMESNRNLKVYIVPKRQQVSNDASFEDIKKILKRLDRKNIIFGKLKGFEKEGRLHRVKEGPSIQGVDGRRISEEVAAALEQEPGWKLVGFFCGQANFETTQGWNIDRYYKLIAKGEGLQRASGLDQGRKPYIFAYIPAGITAGVGDGYYKEAIDPITKKPLRVKKPDGTYEEDSRVARQTLMDFEEAIHSAQYRELVNKLGQGDERKANIEILKIAQETGRTFAEVVFDYDIDLYESLARLKTLGRADNLTERAKLVERTLWGEIDKSNVFRKSPFREDVERLCGVKDLVTSQRIAKEEAEKRARSFIRAIAIRSAKLDKRWDEIKGDQALFNRTFGVSQIVAVAGRGSRYSRQVHKALVTADQDETNVRLAISGSYKTPTTRPVIVISSNQLRWILKEKFVPRKASDIEQMEKGLLPSGWSVGLIPEGKIDLVKRSKYFTQDAIVVLEEAQGSGYALTVAMEILKEQGLLEDTLFKQIVFGEMGSAQDNTKSNASLITYMEAVIGDYEITAGGKKADRLKEGGFSLKDKGNFFLRNGRLVKLCDWHRLSGEEQEILIDLGNVLKNWKILPLPEKRRLRQNFAIDSEGNILINSNTVVYKNSVMEYFDEFNDRYRHQEYWMIDEKTGQPLNLAWDLIDLIGQRLVKEDYTGPWPIGFVDVGNAPASLKDVDRQDRFTKAYKQQLKERVLTKISHPDPQKPDEKISGVKFENDANLTVRLGSNTEFDLEDVETLFTNGETAEGITIEGRVRLDPAVKIANNVKLKNCTLCGKISIGDGVTIENAYIEGPVTIPAGVKIANTVIVPNAEIKADVRGLSNKLSDLVTELSGTDISSSERTLTDHLRQNRHLAMAIALNNMLCDEKQFHRAKDLLLYEANESLSDYAMVMRLMVATSFVFNTESTLFSMIVELRRESNAPNKLKDINFEIVTDAFDERMFMFSLLPAQRAISVYHPMVGDEWAKDFLEKTRDFYEEFMKSQEEGVTPGRKREVLAELLDGSPIEGLIVETLYQVAFGEHIISDLVSRWKDSTNWKPHKKTGKLEIDRETRELLDVLIGDVELSRLESLWRRGNLNESAEQLEKNLNIVLGRDGPAYDELLEVFGGIRSKLNKFISKVMSETGLSFEEASKAEKNPLVKQEVPLGKKAPRLLGLMGGTGGAPTLLMETLLGEFVGGDLHVPVIGSPHDDGGSSRVAQDQLRSAKWGYIPSPGDTMNVNSMMTMKENDKAGAKREIIRARFEKDDAKFKAQAEKMRLRPGAEASFAKWIVAFLRDETDTLSSKEYEGAPLDWLYFIRYAKRVAEALDENLIKPGLLKLHGGSVGNFIYIGHLVREGALSNRGTIGPITFNPAMVSLAENLGLQNGYALPSTLESATLYAKLEALELLVNGKSVQLRRKDTKDKRYVGITTAGVSSVVEEKKSLTTTVGGVETKFELDKEGNITLYANGIGAKISEEFGDVVSSRDSKTMVAIPWDFTKQPYFRVQHGNFTMRLSKSSTPDKLDIKLYEQVAETYKQKPTVRWGDELTLKNGKKGIVWNISEDKDKKEWKVTVIVTHDVTANYNEENVLSEPKKASSLAASAKVSEDSGGKLMVSVRLDTKGQGTTIYFGETPVTFRGRLIMEQTNITESIHTSTIVETGFLDNAKPTANPKVLELIKNTQEAIVIGPGSFVTSILPILMVGEVVEEISKKKKEGLPVIFIVNPFKDNETVDITVSRLVRLIEDVTSKAAGRKVRIDELVSHIIVNDLDKTPAKLKPLMNELTGAKLVELMSMPREPGEFAASAKLSRGELGVSESEMVELYNLVKIIKAPLAREIKREKRVAGKAQYELGVGYDAKILGQTIETTILEPELVRIKGTSLYTDVLDTYFGGDEKMLDNEIRRLLHEGRWLYSPETVIRTPLDVLKEIKQKRAEVRVAYIGSDEIANRPPRIIISNAAHTLVRYKLPTLEKKIPVEELSSGMKTGLENYLRGGGFLIIFSALSLEEIQNAITNHLDKRLRKQIILVPYAGAESWEFNAEGKLKAEPINFGGQLTLEQKEKWRAIVKEAEKEYQLDRYLYSPEGLIDNPVVINDRGGPLIVFEMDGRRNLPDQVAEKINEELKKKGLPQITKEGGILNDERVAVIEFLNQRFKEEGLPVIAEKGGTGAINTRLKAIDRGYVARDIIRSVNKERLKRGEAIFNEQDIYIIGKGNEAILNAMPKATGIYFREEPSEVIPDNVRIYPAGPGPYGVSAAEQFFNQLPIRSKPSLDLQPPSKPMQAQPGLHRAAITIETPRNYKIDEKVRKDMAAVINTMAAQTGLWANFQDAGKVMLGWMNLASWREKENVMSTMEAFANQVQQEKREGKTTDIVFIGQGGSIECIKTLYNIFGKDQNSPNVHIMDTIDQEVITNLKNTLPLEKTRFVILSKSMTTMEVHSLYKLFFDLYVERGIKNPTNQFTLITDKGKAEVVNNVLKVAETVRTPFREEALARGFSNVFYIEPYSGGRYSWDTAVGILPALIMGQNVANILEGARTAEELAKSPELEMNPMAQYGVFKYMMSLEGRNRPTLILPEELKAYGPWSGQLDTESLGKTPEKSSLTIDHENPAANLNEYTNKRFFVRIKMGENDRRLDKLVASLENAESPFPVITITLPNSSPGRVNPKDIGALLKTSEFATVIAGYLMGETTKEVNPVNQPGVEEYKKAQELYLKTAYSENPLYIAQKGNVKLDYRASIEGINKITEKELNEVLEKIGRTDKNDVAARYAALLYLAAKEKARDYAVMMIFKRLALNPKLENILNEWRYGIRANLRIDTLGEEAPCILHAKQQGFQQGENNGFFTVVRFARYKGERIVIPGSKERYGEERTFEELIKAQAIGTVEALSHAKFTQPSGVETPVNRLGVMVELANENPETIAEFASFVNETVSLLNRLMIIAQPKPGTIDLSKVAGMPIELNAQTGEIAFGEGVVSEPRWSRPLVDAGTSIANPSAITEANAAREVYYGYRNVRLKQDTALVDLQKLRFDITVLQPGVIHETEDREFIMTKGHIHPTTNYPEFYEVWNGTALYVQQGRNLKTGNFEFIATLAKPSDKVLLIPGYSHRTVNIGNEPLVMANWISEEVGGKEAITGVREVIAGKVKADFSEIEAKNGYAYHIIQTTEGGIELRQNPKYGPAPADIRFTTPAAAIPELNLSKVSPMYPVIENEAQSKQLSTFLSNPKGLEQLYSTAHQPETLEGFARKTQEVLPRASVAIKTGEGEAEEATPLSAEKIEEYVTKPDIAALESTLFMLSHTYKDLLVKDGKVIIVWDRDITGIQTTDVAQQAEKLTSRYLGDAVINVRGNADNADKLLGEIQSHLKSEPIRAIVTIAGDKTLGRVIGDGRTLEKALTDLHGKSRVLNIQNIDASGNLRHIPVPALYNLAIELGFDMPEEKILQCLRGIGDLVTASGNPIDPRAILTDRVVRILPRIRPVDADADARAQTLARQALERSL